MPMTDNCIRRCYGIVSFSRRGGSYLSPVNFLLIRAFSLPKNYVLGQLGIFIDLSLFCYKSLYIRCKEAAAAQQILNIAISMYIIDTDGYL